MRMLALPLLGMSLLPLLPVSCAPEVDEPAIHAWLVTEVGFVRAEPKAQLEAQPPLSLFDRAAKEGKRLCLAVDTPLPTERDEGTIYAEIDATDYYRPGNVYYLELRDGQYYTSRVCEPSKGYCRTCR